MKQENALQAFTISVNNESSHKLTTNFHSFYFALETKGNFGAGQLG